MVVVNLISALCIYLKQKPSVLSFFTFKAASALQLLGYQLSDVQAETRSMFV